MVVVTLACRSRGDRDGKIGSDRTPHRGEQIAFSVLEVLEALEDHRPV